MERISSLAGFLVTGIVVTLIVKLVRTILLERRVKRLHDCKNPPKYPHKDPIGYDLYKTFEKATINGDTVSVALDRYRNVGPTHSAKFFGRSVIYTCQVENMQSVFALQSDRFSPSPMRQQFSKGWFGNGVFVSDGETWKQARNRVKPIFKRAEISDLGVFKKHTDTLLRVIPVDGQTVDLQPLFMRFYLDVTTEFLFGQSTSTLVPGSEKIDANRFIQEFNNALRLQFRRVKLGPLAVFLGQDKEYVQACKKVNGIIEESVDRALRKIKDGKITHESQKEDASSSPVVLLYELAKQSQDRVWLRDQLVNVFVPGRDSSSIGLSQVFFQIARAPRVWDKLRAEVLELGDTMITFEVLKSLKYLQAILSESLRLLAPAGRTIRHATRDTTLPVGGGADCSSPIFVAKGTQIELDWTIMQLDETFWGTDARVYRPERWLEMKKPSQWEYIPFLGGPRICPAQQMILTQYAYVLRFAQAFERCESRDPVERFVEEHRMTKQSRNGVKVGLIPASG